MLFEFSNPSWLEFFWTPLTKQEARVIPFRGTNDGKKEPHAPDHLNYFGFPWENVKNGMRFCVPTGTLSLHMQRAIKHCHYNIINLDRLLWYSLAFRCPRKIISETSRCRPQILQSCMLCPDLFRKLNKIRGHIAWDHPNRLHLRSPLKEIPLVLHVAGVVGPNILSEGLETEIFLKKFESWNVIRFLRLWN